MTRYANSVLFGFDFQSNAAIVLMIENMADLETIRIEGEEDIEIGLNDGSFVLAQAKSVVNSSTDFDNVRQKGKKAMESLSEASQRLNVRRLVYISNSPDPFKDDASKPMFYGKSRVKFNNLPKQTKGIISGWLSEIEKPLDTDKLTVQVLPFETDDDDQRYKVILDIIADFIGEVDLSYYYGLRKRLHEVWQSMFDKNGSKSNRNIKLTKKDVVWPIIVFVTGHGGLDRETQYCADLDDCIFDEVQRKYGELIEETCERFDITAKVVTDFYEKKNEGRQAIESFVDEYWTDYQNEFGLDSVDDSIKSSLTKIIVFTILKKRIDINKIKQSVNL